MTEPPTGSPRFARSGHGTVDVPLSSGSGHAYGMMKSNKISFVEGFAASRRCFRIDAACGASQSWVIVLRKYTSASLTGFDVKKSCAARRVSGHYSEV